MCIFADFRVFLQVLGKGLNRIRTSANVEALKLMKKKDVATTKRSIETFGYRNNQFFKRSVVKSIHV